MKNYLLIATDWHAHVTSYINYFLYVLNVCYQMYMLSDVEVCRCFVLVIVIVYMGNYTMYMLQCKEVLTNMILHIPQEVIN